MTFAEVHDLLTLIRRVDNRNFDDATVIAWREVLAAVEYDDCVQAVVDHFRTSDAYLMPVHIVRGAGALARARLRVDREEREAIEAAAYPAVVTEERAAAVADLLAEARARLGPGDPAVLRRREWVELERNRQRAERAAAEPNPHFAGFPPPDGHPVGDAQVEGASA